MRGGGGEAIVGQFKRTRYTPRWYSQLKVVWRDVRMLVDDLKRADNVLGLINPKMAKVGGVIMQSKPA